MNTYAWLIVLFVLGRYSLDLLADLLNLRRLDERLPHAFEGWYDSERYRRSQLYLRDSTRLGIVRDTAGTVLLLLFLLSGGLAWSDRLVRAAGCGPVISGLLFAGGGLILWRVLMWPFDGYDSFVIEQRYGFNRMTWRTFLADEVKGLALLIVLGGGVFACVQWLFLRAGGAAWILVWAVVALFHMVMGLVAPYVLLPLFNRFDPLPEGPLRSALEAYARSQHFRVSGIYTMDGSRRSAKANAFFTGLGRSRRIVLFDTLVDQHNVEELKAIVAHEMGHYKKGHLFRSLAWQWLTSALLFFLLSRFMMHPPLFAGFGVEEPSLYLGFFLFGLLYIPLAKMLSMAAQMMSRRHEYQADAFAAATTGDPGVLIRALKRLAMENLSNLTPHPFTVVTGYSHPPVCDRIAALAGFNSGGRRAPAVLPGSAPCSRDDASPVNGAN